MRKVEVLKVIFLLLGTVIGAGFASGKEIFMFFGSFSFLTLISIIMCGISLFLVSYMFLNCKHKCNFYYFQKSKIGIGFDVIMFFFMFLSVSALTAAITSAYGFIISILSLLLTLLIVFMGIKCLKNINFVLAPIVIAVIIFVSVANLNQNHEVLLNAKPIFFNSFLYVGMNIFLASEVLVDAGQLLTKKEKFWSALISSMVFCLIIILISICFSYNNITNHDEMPILKMASKLSPIVYKIYLFVLWAGIFTTLTSVVYSMKSKANKIFGWGKIFVFIICLIALALSLFGFQKIINIVYPVEGFVGVIYSLIIFVLIFASEGKKKSI